MMNNNYMYGHGMGMMDTHFGMSAGLFFLVAAIVLIWSFYWKGRALWTAARHGQLVWFIILLLVNTLGILDIVYIYFFACDCTKDENDHEKHIHGHAHTHHDHTQQQG